MPQVSSSGNWARRRISPGDRAWTDGVSGRVQPWYDGGGFGGFVDGRRSRRASRRVNSVAFLMRKALLVLPALALLLGAVASPSVRAASEPRTVRVGLYYNEPKIWRAADGSPHGLFPDILSAIAANENWEIEYVYGTWDDGLRNLESGAIDIMPDVAFSDERQQVYDFNEETVLVNWGAVYAREGVAVESIMDLAGKRIAILKNGIHYNGTFGLEGMFEAFGIEAEIVDVQEYEEVFELLDRGRVNIGVVNRTFGITNEGNYDIVRTGVVFNPTELRFAMMKGNPDNAYLIERLDDNLRQMKASTDSAYHRSVLRHLGGITERVEVFPGWFRYPAALAAAMVLGGVIYVFVLRAVRRRLEAAVTERTADLKAREEQFRSIFERSGDANVLVDLESMKIIEANASAVKMVRVKEKDDLIGREPAEFSAAFQHGGRPAAEVIRETVERNDGGFLEWVVRRADGTEIRTLATFSPLDLEGQRIAHVSVRAIPELNP